jgi:hypothetical protein
MKFKVVEKEQHRYINPLDNFKWVAGADVQAVWRKHGWTPPSEYRTDFLFRQNREGKQS